MAIPSSDDMFQDMSMHAADWDQIDSLTANITAATSNLPKTAPATASAKPLRTPLPPPPRPQPEIINLASDDSDNYFDDIQLNDAALEQIDQLVEDNSRPFKRAPSKPTIQTTLLGGTIPNAPPKPTRSFQRTQSKAAAPPAPPKPKKLWDRTAFAKTGWSSKAKKDKARDAVADDDEVEDEDEEHEEDEGFAEFPPPLPQFDANQPPPPMKLKPDLSQINQITYPLNKPKRDYQYNIIMRCLFQNTLVALPTGLGKTFIAGVVMLNFYNWFPEGKIIFMAPTKPLVNQQIEACHHVCGILQEDTAVMTGTVSRQIRSRYWIEKRVFFMTPQTLQNDLKGGYCDPSNIVLLVVDEAHRGTGNYAYAEVVRFMMHTNPHHRILALTATPGNGSDAVQAVVDSLHISNIEIRDERSLDLQPYLFKKHTEQHVVEMDADTGRIRDLLSDLIMDIAKPVHNAGLLRFSDPVKLHPYFCQVTMKQVGGQKEGGGRNMKWALPALATLGKLARAMGNLIEGSIHMCYTTLIEACEGVSSDGKKASNKRTQDSLRKNPKFTELITEIERQRNAGPVIHPKMDKVKSLLIEHFAQAAMDDEEAASSGRPSQSSENARIMVFASYRDCVDEIVEYLNEEKPMIRATRFVGQGTTVRGKKGMPQKEQLGVIQRFKSGEFNVLVSTSIGEEGLDIGEIDVIICYDAQKDSIKMLQRIGRTGRKGEGRVHVLMSAVREEGHWKEAQESYKGVQGIIQQGRGIDLYDDVERLLPADVQPKVLEMEMPIQEYIQPEVKTRKTRVERAPKATKRKRNDDVSRNIPEGATTGFVTAAKLTKRRKVVAPDEPDLETDSTDDELLTSKPWDVRKSSKASSAKKVKEKKGTEKKSKGKAAPKPKARRKPKAKFKEPQLESEEDSADERLERGLHGILSRHRARSSSPEPLLAQFIKNASKNGRNLFPGTSPPEPPPETPATPVQSPQNSTVFAPKESEFPSTDALLPSRSSHSGTLHEEDSPDRVFPRPDTMSSPSLPSTQPIIAPGRKRKRLAEPPASLIEINVTSPLKRRLKRQSQSREHGSPSRRNQVAEAVARFNRRGPFVDNEAVHSGDEVSAGSSGSDEEEGESDREFVQPLPETQMATSYPQTQVYRSSVLTQAPINLQGPLFRNPKAKHPAFVTRESAARRPGVSSSPAPSSEVGDYELDSFVVEDNENVLDQEPSSEL
ncbi:P-loop containing nucleoside triphosphate hydrolase protein [Sistotremastrum suecicum HHB10207 ss-3]|uniref:ATP-dependent DNA helicase n=1 Tax=Sistotremastrum suecicum HHB10207 ss-3 TaxID=1314776 RepID=A0A166G634_9AGAM|nr:P-loop containing nucleoside triphosphate hydrolase protein [Sistotremastrum suecicum HHB10207 ss-3]